MEVIRTGGYDDLSRIAASIVAETIGRGPCSLGLPTGRTPLGLYQELVRRQSDWSGVRAFNLDEYLGLPPGHPASFRTYMCRNLMDLLHSPPAWDIPDGSTRDPEGECQRYEAAIAAAGGLDLVVLGLGRNGHIGFNEPGSPFDSRTRVTRLSESTRQANRPNFPPGEEVPTYAITMGIGTILGARRILLLASGRDKAEALNRSLLGPVARDVPASALQRHPRVIVLADAEACGSEEGDAGLGGGVNPSGSTNGPPLSSRRRTGATAPPGRPPATPGPGAPP